MAWEVLGSVHQLCSGAWRFNWPELLAGGAAADKLAMVGLSLQLVIGDAIVMVVVSKLFGVDSVLVVTVKPELVSIILVAVVCIAT
jgi:hypothetical protein